MGLDIVSRVFRSAVHPLARHAGASTRDTARRQIDRDPPAPAKADPRPPPGAHAYGNPRDGTPGLIRAVVDFAQGGLA